MDGHRFDDLTRALAGGASRRRVLRGLAAGVAGAFAGTFSRRRVGAQQECREVDRACYNDFECCGGGFNGNSSAFCFKPRGRDRGKCTCREGFEECGGECVDPIGFCESGLFFENCRCVCEDGSEPCRGSNACCEFGECIEVDPGFELCRISTDSVGLP